MIVITSKKLRTDGNTASNAQVNQTTSSTGITRYELGGPVAPLPGDNSRPSESIYRKWPAIMFKWDWSKYNEETKNAILPPATLKLNDMLVYENTIDRFILKPVPVISKKPVFGSDKQGTTELQ